MRKTPLALTALLLTIGLTLSVRFFTAPETPQRAEQGEGARGAWQRTQEGAQKATDAVSDSMKGVTDEMRIDGDE